MFDRRPFFATGLALAFVALLVISALPVAAQSKEEVLSQMTVLGEQIDAARARGDETAAQSLLGQYEQLRAQSTGEDPAGLGNGGPSLTVAPEGAAIAPAGCTASLTTVSDAPGVAIPDGPGGMVSVDLIVAGAGSFLGDLDLTMDITHTFAADLEIVLTSPAGTTATVTTDNGGGNDDVFSGTLFDDGAPNTVTDFTYTNLVTAGPLVPEGAFGAFYGEDPNGTWTMTVVDDAGLDTGTLNSWQLDVTTFDQVPTTAGPAAFADAPGVAIPDGPGGMVSVDLAVSGLDTFLSDLNLTMDITHTFAADLEITLTSPAGTTATVTTDNGGGNDDVFSGALFDDDAPDTVTDFTYTNLVTAGPLVPEGAFAAFYGEDPNGTWTMTVVDDAGLDTGTINSWQLDIDTATCGAPGPAPGEVLDIPTLDTLGLILLLAGLGLAGLFVIRRRLA